MNEGGFEVGDLIRMLIKRSPLTSSTKPFFWYTGYTDTTEAHVSLFLNE